jgi:ribosome-associated protein
MLIITPKLIIPESELDERFVLASGPGGQNINKVATSVQLRFDLQNSPSLSDTVRERLRHLAGKRVSVEGILVIEARRFRTQAQNRQDARQRLIRMIRKALEIPKVRRATKPTRTSLARRIEAKVHRGKIKKTRSVRTEMDE